MSATWIHQFPALSVLEPDIADRLGDTAQTVSLPAGHTVFHAGDACENFLLVLDGVVRVHMTSETGREIVLYRVDAGETCVLTTACLLGQSPYTAEGVCETAVQAVVLPAQTFQTLMGQSAVLREFVFQSYGVRLAELMSLVENVAFGRLDVRLARLLCEQADAASDLNQTHQNLAVELGSAREVISRQLKEFERRGWLELSRGRIRLRDRAALLRLAND